MSWELITEGSNYLFMKKISIALCLLLTLVAIQVVQFSADTSEQSQPPVQPNALTSSRPLFIGSVSHITDTYGFPGSGTAANPYLITGLSIESTTAEALIDIRNINVHVLITGNFLNASGITYHGIYIEDASNIRIVNNEI